MKTEIETCTHLSVSLSEEDKETLRKAKDIINDICTIAGNCGTTILPGNGDEILLSEILETLEEIDYFVEIIDGRQVEIIPY
jgi:hypothetical protein